MIRVEGALPPHLERGLQHASSVHLMAWLLGPGQASGHDHVWYLRHQGLLAPVVAWLIWERDQEGVLLTVRHIRGRLQIDSILAGTQDERIPEPIRGSLEKYLRSLPLYREQEPWVVGETGREHHGYLEAMTVPAFRAAAERMGVWEAFAVEERLTATLPAAAGSGERQRL